MTQRSTTRLLRSLVWPVLLGLTTACAPTDGEQPSQVVDLSGALRLASFFPAAGIDSRSDRTVSTPEIRAAGQVVALRSSGSLVLPMPEHEGEAAIHVTFRFRSEDATTGGLLSVSVLDQDGHPHWLSDFPDGGEEWASAKVELPTNGSDRDYVVFSATFPAHSQSLELRDPQLQIDGLILDNQAMGTGTPVPIPPEAGLPNVVIIILDAARARNFGAYGYGRDTTPFIDRLADDALVFTHAYSECASTSCSIPNLISGVSFLGTGSEGGWPMLDSDVTTLAEHLVGIGYHTVGLSANPNNAIARNTHQGFAEFHEMWASDTRRRHPERRDPHRLSRRAVASIRTVNPSQPVFALLHYVPPHEPYQPTQEFDVFGDPAYDGPVRPGMLYRDLRRGRQTLSPADVERMVSLYDGNLRMADDAVEQLFAALREVGRWENSLVLVTSDHGEAFFEHGVQGHNTTLYEEMVHIPFILRVPTGVSVPSLDRNRLVMLSDVLPTVLGQVGLEPGKEVDGIDILRPGGEDWARVTFQRHRLERFFVARTGRWKGFFSPDGRVTQLFDIETDPGETVDLVEDRPLLHHGLAALLRQHLSHARGRFGSEDVELPEQDLQELRSLGYLR